MSPTMSLVIGIIIGSFTAMILIVIIVLKVRTGVDISEIKQVTVNIFLSYKCHLVTTSYARRKCKGISLQVLQVVQTKTTSPSMRTVLLQAQAWLKTTNLMSMAMEFSMVVCQEHWIQTVQNSSKKPTVVEGLCESGMSRGHPPWKWTYCSLLLQVQNISFIVENH